MYIEFKKPVLEPSKRSPFSLLMWYFAFIFDTLNFIIHSSTTITITNSRIHITEVVTTTTLRAMVGLVGVSILDPAVLLRSVVDSVEIVFDVLVLLTTCVPAGKER